MSVYLIVIIRFSNTHDTCSQSKQYQGNQVSNYDKFTVPPYNSSGYSSNKSTNECAIPSPINGGGGGACESMMSRIYSMTYISIASISMISI